MFEVLEAVGVDLDVIDGDHHDDLVGRLESRHGSIDGAERSVIERSGFDRTRTGARSRSRS